MVESYSELPEFTQKLTRQLHRMLNDTSRFSGPEGHTIAAIVANVARMQTGISNDALDLLRKAVKRDGHIGVIRHLGGLHIQVGPDVIDTSTPRLSAKWRSAVEELTDAEYISDMGHKGEIFEVTERGDKLCEAVDRNAA